MYPNLSSLFLFNAPPTTEIYTLSLHDALPILLISNVEEVPSCINRFAELRNGQLIRVAKQQDIRSEEHTSELQSRFDLVCRLLLEKKKKTNKKYTTYTSSL